MGEDEKKPLVGFDVFITVYQKPIVEPRPYKPKTKYYAAYFCDELSRANTLSFYREGHCSIDYNNHIVVKSRDDFRLLCRDVQKFLDDANCGSSGIDSKKLGELIKGYDTSKDLLPDNS